MRNGDLQKLHWQVAIFFCNINFYSSLVIFYFKNFNKDFLIKDFGEKLK